MNTMYMMKNSVVKNVTNSASYLRKHIEIKHEIRCNQMHQCIMHQIPWSMLRFVWEVQKVISEEEKNIHSIAEKTIPARNVRIKLI